MSGEQVIFLVNFSGDTHQEIASSLREEGFKVVKDDLKVLKRKKNSASLVLFNLERPDEKTLSLFRKTRRHLPDIPFIVLSSPGPACIERVLKLVTKEGAYDYIKKPFLMDELKIIVRRALKKEKTSSSEKTSSFSFLPSDFVLGKNQKMKEIVGIIKEIAPTELTILIRGESGTGKEMLASIIHKLSKRYEGPFLRLNCAAICESIMESELFGYERGAFTGADTRKKGLFSAADGGTLLLDEIAKASLNTQAKLLGVIERKEFIPVGGISPVKCDVRLIIATNSNLEEEIKKGRFLADLYYRINTFSISLPPLRERREDIPLLVEHFLKKYNSYFGKNIKRVSPEVYNFLVEYPWPGNIRELESFVVKMVVVCKGSSITLNDIKKFFPHKALKKKRFLPFEEAKRSFLTSFEEKYIRELLLLSQGNIKAAAEKAGVTRAFIYQKIRKYNIDLSFYRRKSSPKEPSGSVY